MTLFAVEDQKVALETKWSGNATLDPEEVETQEIIDMYINWLVDCDSMSLIKIGSDFIAVEDEYSISFFVKNQQSFV